MKESRPTKFEGLTGVHDAEKIFDGPRFEVRQINAQILAIATRFFG